MLSRDPTRDVVNVLGVAGAIIWLDVSVERGCQQIERLPEKLSGTPVLAGSLRLAGPFSTRFGQVPALHDHAK
jgi:hypothetical protein